MSDAPFIHPQALCESQAIGPRTRVWAFAHVLPGAVVGADCNLCDHVFLENDVQVGDRVTIKCGVQLWDGVRLGDDVFVGPNVTFTNDKRPRSRMRPQAFLPTVVEAGASIGANATILPGLTIGRNAFIGAGSVVTRSVPPNAIVYGNPARIMGYASGGPGEERKSSLPLHRLPDSPATSAPREPVALGVGGCSLCPLPVFKDLRGGLMAVEFGKELPFVPVRQFFVHNVPNDKVRGEHAHRACEQFLIAISGTVHVVVNDGASSAEVCLDAPDWGLHMRPGVWGTQYNFSADAILAVYASLPYDPADYVRSFDAFMAEFGTLQPDASRS